MKSSKSPMGYLLLFLIESWGIRNRCSVFEVLIREKGKTKSKVFVTEWNSIARAMLIRKRPRTFLLSPGKSCGIFRHLQEGQWCSVSIGFVVGRVRPFVP